MWFETNNRFLKLLNLVKINLSKEVNSSIASNMEKRWWRGMHVHFWIDYCFVQVYALSMLKNKCFQYVFFLLHLPPFLIGLGLLNVFLGLKK